MDIAFLKALMDVASVNEPFCFLNLEDKLLICTSLKTTFSSINDLPKNVFSTGWQNYDGLSGQWSTWESVVELEPQISTDSVEKSLEIFTTSFENWSSSIEKDDFVKIIETMQSEMDRGDYFLANLTRNVRTSSKVDVIFVAALSAVFHQTPFRFFHFDPQRSFLGLSPEKFIEINKQEIISKPMKGTSQSSLELKQSQKEYDENTMMIDLMRSDLSKVAVPETIEVISRDDITDHPGLKQMSSTIKAKLEETDIVRAIGKLLPVASVTGTPKPKVVERISDLEPEPRNQYCGIYGIVDTRDSSSTLAVSIRSLIFEAKESVLGIGAGITLGSVPLDEWNETELKAHRLQKLLNIAHIRDESGVFTSTSINSSGEIFQLNAHLDRIESHTKVKGLSFDRSLTKKKISEMLKSSDNKNQNYLKIEVEQDLETQIEFAPTPKKQDSITLGLSPFPYIQGNPATKNIDRTIYQVANEIGRLLSRIRIDDTLLINGANVRETTRANLFLLINSTIVTPKLTTNEFEGTTRNFLLGCFKDNGIKFEIANLDLNDIAMADEAITVNAIRGPIKINRISSQLLNHDIQFDENSNFLFDLAKQSFDNGFELIV